jgi:ubiquinol-cytochrome c reductase cytochrome b subunit
MLGRLATWFDDRSGSRKLVAALLIERIPGGARWRYVWGSCLAFVFAIQLITGVLLMTSYSAGDSTAWSSVYFIQYQMDFGWFIRGLHHFGSQTMVVLLGVHMLQVVIAGAHLPPREINWWLGLGLLGMVLGLSLTGYLLPWDQKGYWATQVATNIAGNQPVVGPQLQKIIVGGPTYGHHTLTRFYALHTAMLPPLVIVFIILHLMVFRRHGVTHGVPPGEDGEPLPSPRDSWFWPEQAFRDLLVSMLIFGVMIGLVLWGHGQKIEPSNSSAEGAATAQTASLYERWAHAGRDGKGANLDAPADPSRPYPARPEWYFLFLFQLLKYFEGEQEIIATVVIPVAAGVLLALLPLLGYGRMRKFGHAVGLLVIVGLLVGVGVLTFQAIAKDRGDTAFQEEVAKSEEYAHRAVQLAAQGIPAEGAVYLLRRDPKTRGAELFTQNCASCHSYGNEIKNGKATASDLAGFGAKEWVAGLLSDPDNPHYLALTKLKTMTGWVKRERDKAKKSGKENELDAEFDSIAGWLGSHPRGDIPASQDQSPFARGYHAFDAKCSSCHSYKGNGGGDANAPDFTGYGDADWIRLMVMAPSHPERYGNHNAMPAFRDLEGVDAHVRRAERDLLRKKLLEEAADNEKKKVEESLKVVNLSDIDRELIIRWLVGDDRVVFGGEPISAPPK